MIHKVVDVETVGHVPNSASAAVVSGEVDEWMGERRGPADRKVPTILVNEVGVWYLRRYAG